MIKHVKHPLFLSDFNETLSIYRQFSIDTQISTSMKIRRMEAETDRRTHKHDEANSSL